MCIGTEIFFSKRYDKDFTIESDTMIEKGNMHASIYSIHITLGAKETRYAKIAFGDL